MNTLSDQQLIERYRRGELACFDELTRRYLKLIYSISYFFVRSQPDAEDLTQETFLKVLQKLHTYDARFEFRPWISQIARHTALDWLKKKKALAFSDIDGQDTGWAELLPDGQPTPQERAISRETRQTVTALLSDIPVAYRRVLKLRYVDGLKFHEIAHRLGLLLDTVKTQHRRALIAVKKLALQDKCFDTAFWGTQQK